MSLKKVEAFWHNGPSDSNATGTKIWLEANAIYFCSFFVAAFSAALPAALAVDATYDVASVSATVTSQIADLPTFHGICVMPSGLLPSLRERPAGSLVEGTAAQERTRAMTSFR